MSVHCADTSALLKERVQFFPALCWLENVICDQLAGLGGTEQLWGDGADASGQPPKAQCPTPASAAASHQQRGSACPCKFAVELGGSLLSFVLLERAGAEHRRLLG